MKDIHTYFITGVAGFLGSHLAESLLKDGHRVIGCDNLVGGYLDNVPAGVELHAIDCSDRAKMAELLRGVEVVYHTAAYAYEGLSVFSPYLVSENIFGGTVSVVSAAIANKVKRFVQCSSMARYGTQPIIPFTEDMDCRPQDPYGIAKYAAELTVRNLCEVHGMEYVIAVPHNIIGPRQKYDDPFRNVASIMINLMLQGRQPIIYGDGEQKRGFSFVDDVVAPLKRMGTDAAPVGEVINIGPDDQFITINELAATIARLLDFKLAPVYMPGRPQEVRYATCSADKARKLLDYKTTMSLEDGLTSMIRYIRTRGPKSFLYHLDLEIVNDKTPRTWKDRLF
ncbi:MAG: NAD-dependent epimerase/dehydratase [Parcubacteria group bacterium GW2011_GWB1_57_6]|nr:MAG: NAD-dependent epimerase/dehydratase [Parcubacteria group bacterium GW2011_GWA1_56_13]KKW46310.1 MAG: NAD-dependent epimerase/dehydratase [Parcubacteria group bacterium GW2011_GWB1_57_6]